MAAQRRHRRGQGARSPATPAFDGGSGTLRIDGAGDQVLTGRPRSVPAQLPNLVIDKPSGTLSLAGTIRTLEDWTYVAGTLDASGSTVSFDTGSVLAGSHTLGNVVLRGAGSVAMAGGDTLTVAGLLSLTNGTLGRRHPARQRRPGPGLHLRRRHRHAAHRWHRRAAVHRHRDLDQRTAARPGPDRQAVRNVEPGRHDPHPARLDLLGRRTRRRWQHARAERRPDALHRWSDPQSPPGARRDILPERWPRPRRRPRHHQRNLRPRGGGSRRRRHGNRRRNARRLRSRPPRGWRPPRDRHAHRGWKRDHARRRRTAASRHGWRHARRPQRRRRGWRDPRRRTSTCAARSISCLAR